MSSSGQGNNPVSSGQGHPGQANLYAGNTDYNAVMFAIKQALAITRTCTIVQIVSCTVHDEVGLIGFVDALPLVNLVDGTFNSFPHGTLHNLSYARVSGGPNAIICDPQVGDIGVAVIADRDISVVKKTKKQAAPGSGRRFALADGVYLFPVLSKTAPTQYVRFVVDQDGVGQGLEAVDALGNSIKTSTTGMTLTDKNSNTIVMDTDGIKINGVLFDRSQNVSAVKQFTSSDLALIGGGGKKVVLDGDAVVGGAVVASSSKIKAT